MARIKKPKDESPEQQEIRQLGEAIANKATRGEKTSWNRKMDNMVKLVATLEPIEDEILELIKSKKLPIMDQLTKLRQTMVKECVHPFEYISQPSTDDGIITCRFCNKKINAVEWLKIK